MKNEVEIDQTSYLYRAISLARGEAYLLACAFLCLGVSSLSSLILPNYQVCVFSLLHMTLFYFYSIYSQ